MIKILDIEKSLLVLVYFYEIFMYSVLLCIFNQVHKNAKN